MHVSPNHPTPSAHTCCRIQCTQTLLTTSTSAIFPLDRLLAAIQCRLGWPVKDKLQSQFARLRLKHKGRRTYSQAITAASLQSALLTTPRHPCDLQRRPSASCSEATFRVGSETPCCGRHCHKRRDGNSAAIRLSQRC